jgi:hypothetical protein
VSIGLHQVPFNHRVFDRGYTRASENLTETQKFIPLTRSGVRMLNLWRRRAAGSGDRVFIKTVSGVAVNQLFVVADPQPDSHGGTKLILTVAKTR